MLTIKFESVIQAKNQTARNTRHSQHRQQYQKGSTFIAIPKIHCIKLKITKQLVHVE